MPSLPKMQAATMGGPPMPGGPPAPGGLSAQLAQAQGPPGPMPQMFQPMPMMGIPAEDPALMGDMGMPPPDMGGEPSQGLPSGGLFAALQAMRRS